MKKMIILSLVLGCSTLSFATDEGFRFLETPMEFAPAGHVTQTKMMRIMSEPEDNREHQFFAEVDEEGNLVAVVREALTGEPSLTRIFVADFFDKPAPLAVMDGREVLKLTCEACTVEAGGKLILTYLRSGITETYRDFEMVLAKDQDGHFGAYTPEDNAYIWGMKLISNTVFGRLVGIKRIDINEKSTLPQPAFYF